MYKEAIYWSLGIYLFVSMGNNLQHGLNWVVIYTKILLIFSKIDLNLIKWREKKPNELWKSETKYTIKIDDNVSAAS